MISDIVWGNVLMISVLSLSVLTPISFFSFKLLTGLDVRILNYLSRRNSFLAGVVKRQFETLKISEMDSSKLELENSKLKSERNDLVMKVDEAIGRVDFIDDFFGQFFSSLDFEVIMVLVDSYPGGINTKELSRKLEVNSKKAYGVADRLFKQKWLTKTKTKGFPRTCVWGLKHDKFDVLARLFE